jgi:hypothetical protein
MNTLKIVPVLCGERGTSFTDFLDNGVFHGEVLIKVSGVQTMGRWRR